MIYNLLRFADPLNVRPSWCFAREFLDHVLGSHQLAFITWHQVWPSKTVQADIECTNECLHEQKVLFGPEDSARVEPATFDDTQQVDVPKLAEWIKASFANLGITAKKVVMVDLESPNWWPWTWGSPGNWGLRVLWNNLARQIRLVKELKQKLPDYKIGTWGFPPPLSGGSLYTNGASIEAAFWKLAESFYNLPIDICFPHIYLCSKTHRQYMPVESAVKFIKQMFSMVRCGPCPPEIAPCLWHECYDTWQVDSASGEDNREKQLARQWPASYYRPLLETCLELGSVALWSQPAIPGVYPVWTWDDDWVANGLVPVLTRNKNEY